MRHMKIRILTVLAVPVLAFALSGPAFASVRPAKTDSLVVKITTTSGTTWGKVSIDYTQNGKMKMLGACKVASCTFHPPHMVKLALTESPTHKSTWPFHSWKLVNGGMKAKTSMGSKLKFEIENGMATVTAKYTVSS